MVIVKIKEGLGNQLFQYAAGRGIAQRLGTRLVLDTSSYEDTGPFSRAHARQYHLDKFKIIAPVLGARSKFWIGQLQRQSVTPLRKAIHKSRLLRFVYDKDCGFDEQVGRKRGNVYLDGYWQTERYFTELRGPLREELSLREPAGEDLKPLLARLNEEVSVCVHVRRGDYFSTEIGLKEFANCSLDYYRAGMAYIGARVPGAKFFMFSDDPAWVQNNFAPSENLVIVSGVARSELDDFRLMTNCRHFVISNSTFSWWAAWLGNQPGKIVVAPIIWRRFHELMDRDVVPDSWVRL